MSSVLEGNLVGGGVASGGLVVDLNPTSVGSSSGIIQGRWLLGCRILLNTEILSIADDYIRMPSVLFEGTVLNFGHIERSISAPAGPPRVGDCLVRVDDHNQRLRKLLAIQTARRRLIELFRISDDQLIGGFEITAVTFGDGYVEFTGTDLTSKWMDRPLPMVGTRANFSWMIQGVDEFFMSIIIGYQFSSGANPQGMIPCHHMGPTMTTGSPPVAVDRYSVSRHQVGVSVVRPAIVYRKLSTDAAFSVVDSSEYNLNFTEFFIAADGTFYQPTFLDFFELQEADAKIRIDTIGSVSTPAIGDLPSYTQTDLTPIRYPIDALSIVLFEMIRSVGGDLRADRYNTDSMIAVRDYCVANNIYFDGSIISPITVSAFLSGWQTSHEIDFYVNRHYQYEVAMVVGEDTQRPVLTDTFDFLKITPECNNAPFNRFNYSFALNPSTGEWAGHGTYDNAADQAELGNVDYQNNSDQIEVESIQLPFVFDANTALSTIIRRSFYQALGSHRVTFVVSTPEWFERLELADLIGVTHYGGIADGGWVNAEFKVLAIRHDLQKLQTSIDAILRVPIGYIPLGLGGYFALRHFDSSYFGGRYWSHVSSGASLPVGTGGMFAKRYFDPKYFADRYYSG